MSAEHVCDETDGDWIACIDGTIYGPCEYGEDPDDTGSCGGMCEIKGECSCSCHRPALTEEGQ